MNNNDLLLEKFPKPRNQPLQSIENNPSLVLYGKRFYKDQTTIEYLAEFLLIFSSKKFKNINDNINSDTGEYQFKIDWSKLRYYPENKVALKLFAFFPTSKLETRHQVHYQAYDEIIHLLSQHISCDTKDNSEAIQLLQNLLSGFTGVANNRTWVTHCFLPASTSLLAREISWKHSGSKGALYRNLSWDDYGKHELMSYFDHDRHNFMARGGESLFLQLVNLFESLDLEPNSLLHPPQYYEHINFNLPNLKSTLERSLAHLITNGTGGLNELANFISELIVDYDIDERDATLGNIPSASRPEALLFANELANICTSSLGTLEKLELLELLCSLQVLRAHCFQASRLDQTEPTTLGFTGHYVWVVADPDSSSDSSMRKLAQESLGKIDNILYRVLRHKDLPVPASYSEANKHGYDIFKKLGKEIGLVIPRTGASPRFTLNQAILRFLVAALIAPGERIRLNHFYQRIFAHYGIAIGHEQLSIALKWIGKETESDHYSSSSKNTWVEEALKQGGFLVELSDAVSMVENPSAA
ncbi:MAG: hypothetical protein WBP46_16185 [Thiolinea sp.]